MKKLTALLIALAALMAMAGCSSNDSSDESKESKAVSSSSDAKGSEDESGSDTSADTDESSDDPSPDNDSDDSSKDESSSEEEPVKTGLADDGVYTGIGFTIKVDQEKWKVVKDGISSVECVFSYIGDKSDPMSSSANFNIISQKGAGEVKPSEYMEAIKTQYENLGFTVKSDGDTKLNGYDAYQVELQIDQENVSMKMKQIILSKDDTFFVISCSSNSDVYDKLQSEFDAVLDTFKVT